MSRYQNKQSAVLRYFGMTFGLIGLRDVVLEASTSARGGLEGVFFSWLGLASASHGLASVLPRSRPYCLGLGSASEFLPRSWVGLEGSAFPRLGSNQST